MVDLFYEYNNYERYTTSKDQLQGVYYCTSLKYIENYSTSLYSIQNYSSSVYFIALLSLLIPIFNYYFIKLFIAMLVDPRPYTYEYRKPRFSNPTL